MLTLNDIINVSFRKSNFSGYRSEDVDDFIDEVKDSYDLLIKKNIEQKETNDALTAEITRLKKENEELKVYVDQYQKDEDEIKNALISAQKLSDASIREARHKAEIILKDANLKAERIVSSAEVEIMEQKGELDRIKQLVSDFRSNLLDMYKEHLTLVNALPCKKSSVVANPSVSIQTAAKEDSDDTQIFMPPDASETPVQTQEAPAEILYHPVPPPEAGPIEPGPREPLADPQAENKSVPVPVHSVDEADTRSFVLNETEKGQPDKPIQKTEPKQENTRDLRYDVLKFGDDYDIADDLDSPVGIFRRNKK
ncbi:MAG: DivIVA domain-containing protein [Clostridiales bacterium]|jgi:cell division initiation protein|nr:DivIVA domain-containing protein [Clostridiales bacterium]